jgi:hypothetical protein
MSGGPTGYVLVVSLQPLDAVTTLFFGHLAERAPGKIRIVEAGQSGVAGAISEASAVILVRGLFEFEPVVRCARALRIPLYYFIDDNFMVVRTQGDRAASFAARYTEENVREALRGFTGVLVASTPLAEYFAAHRLFAPTRLFPPSTPANRAAEPGGAGRACVAFFGGEHLHSFLMSTIVPAVRRLAQVRPVTVIAVGAVPPIEPSAGLAVRHEPYAGSYTDGVRMLARAGVGVLVHPVAVDLANNIYKNPHALITADYLGAVPVVSNRAPYDGLGTEGVALLCEDTADAWFAALNEAVSGDTGSLRARLAAFCAVHFGGDRNLRVIDAMLQEHEPPAPWSVPGRLATALGILVSDRIGRAVSRVRRTFGR